MLLQVIKVFFKDTICRLGMRNGFDNSILVFTRRVVRCMIYESVPLDYTYMYTFQQVV